MLVRRDVEAATHGSSGVTLLTVNAVGEPSGPACRRGRAHQKMPAGLETLRDSHGDLLFYLHRTCSGLGQHQHRLAGRAGHRLTRIWLPGRRAAREIRNIVTSCLSVKTEGCSPSWKKWNEAGFLIDLGQLWF